MTDERMDEVRRKIAAGFPPSMVVTAEEVLWLLQCASDLCRSVAREAEAHNDEVWLDKLR